MPQLTLDSAILERLLERSVSAVHLVGYIEASVDCGFVFDPLSNEIDAIAHELNELLGKPHLVAFVPSARSTFPAGVIMRDDVVRRGRVPEFARPGVPAASGAHASSLALPATCASHVIERDASRANRAHKRPLNPNTAAGYELTPVLDPVAVTPVPDPVAFMSAFPEDEATRPRVRRLRSTRGPQGQRVEEGPAAVDTESVAAHARQARAPRTLPIEAVDTESVAAHARQARAPRTRPIADARSATWWMRGATVTVLIVLVGLVLRMLGACGGGR